MARPEALQNDVAAQPGAARPGSSPRLAAMNLNRVRRGRRTRSRLLACCPVVLSGAAATGLWWLTVRILGIRAFFLPAPPDIARAFLDAPGYLLRQTAVTAGETVVGFGVASVGAILLAIGLAGWPVLERSLLPLLVAVHSVPKVSLAPLLVVWLGFGPEPKVVMVILICFFPIMLSSAAGLTSTPVELRELAASLAASRWQTFTKIRFPVALPQIFVGLKTGITLAVIGAVVAEISSPNAGLGAVIVTAGTSADTPRAFAAITLLAAVSTALFYGLTGVERLLLRWDRKPG